MYLCVCVCVLPFFFCTKAAKNFGIFTETETSEHVEANQSDVCKFDFPVTSILKSTPTHRLGLHDIAHTQIQQPLNALYLSRELHVHRAVK